MSVSATTYGLVQSAYLWFEEIKGTLKQYGLIQSRHNDALFYNPATELYVNIYVDDIKAFAPTDAPMDELTDLGDFI